MPLLGRVGRASRGDQTPEAANRMPKSWQGRGVDPHARPLGARNTWYHAVSPTHRDSAMGPTGADSGEMLGFRRVAALASRRLWAPRATTRPAPPHPDS